MPQAELSVVLVDDRRMRRLNREYRGRDRSTDVLSFAQQEGPAGAPAGLLGDVVISVPATRRQARERGVPLADEGDRLLVHGVLHLLGYDHEGSTAEARRMQRRERALLGLLRA
jgi:rRNA maturation RNase YbeY